MTPTTTDKRVRSRVERVEPPKSGLGVFDRLHEAMRGRSARPGPATEADGRLERVDPPATPVEVDRRFGRRYEASWPVRVWLQAGLVFLDTHARNAASFGLGLALSRRAPERMLTRGTSVRVQIAGESGTIFLLDARVRHVTGTTLGLELVDPLPRELRDSLSTESPHS